MAARHGKVREDPVTGRDPEQDRMTSMRATPLILAVCALVAAPVGSSIGDFHLPPKTVFSTAMPRYPNVWFYLDASLAADHQAAVKLVTGELRKALHLRELRLPNS